MFEGFSTKLHAKTRRSQRNKRLHSAVLDVVIQLFACSASLRELLLITSKTTKDAETSKKVDTAMAAENEKTAAKTKKSQDDRRSDTSDEI